MLSYEKYQIILSSKNQSRIRYFQFFRGVVLKVMDFWRCRVLSIGLVILCAGAGFASVAADAAAAKKKRTHRKNTDKAAPTSEAPMPIKPLEETPSGISPAPAAAEPVSSESPPPENVERISLPQILERAASSVLVKEGVEALMRSAQAKLEQVQMEKWLSTFELQGFTGVVPDVRADTAVRNQDTDQLLFGLQSDAVNDGGWSRLGPVSYTHLTLPTNREV